MSRSTATAVKSSGPISRSEGMFVFEGRYARAYSTHWTIGRMFYALFLLALMAIGFFGYAEYRYRFAPSAYFNGSPVEIFMAEFSRSR